MQTIKKILFILSSRERKHAGLLLSMILIMALLDMIGVASILPFMAVLTNPSVIETNSILNKMLEFSTIFGIENDQEFLFGYSTGFILQLDTGLLVSFRGVEKKTCIQQILIKTFVLNCNKLQKATLIEVVIL